MHLTLRKGFALIGIILGMALTTMNFSILNNALPSIQKNLSASVLQLQWIVNIYGIFLASCILLMGRLADQYGHRRLFLLSIFGIALGSLAAGSAQSSNWIIAAQALIGFAGSAVLPLAQILILNEFPKEEHSKAMGIWAGGIGCMLGIGPLVGGWILDWWNWRWVFFINIPIAIASILLVFFAVRKPHAPKRLAPIDWKSAILVILTIAALIVGLMQGADWGWLSLWTLGAFALFALFGSSLVYSLYTTRHPLIPAPLFRRTFFFPSSMIFCLNFSIWALFFLFPLYLQNIRNFSPSMTGLMMLLFTGPVALFGPAVGNLYHKIGSKPLLLVGFFSSALSTWLQSLLNDSSSLWFVMGSSVLFGIGWLLIYSSAAAAALFDLPKQLEGVGAGTFATILEVGGAVGLAIAGTVFRIADAHSLIRALKESEISFLPDIREQIREFVINPIALKRYIELQTSSLSDSAFWTLFDNSFVAGYRSAMWILCAVALVGLLVAALHKNCTK